MKRRKIPITLEEILFRNRNKKYGSYQLRKQYYRRLGASFLISILLFTTTALVLFWHFNAGNYILEYPSEIPVYELKATEGSLLKPNELQSFLQQDNKTSKDIPDPLHNFKVAEKAVEVRDTVMHSVTEKTDSIEKSNLTDKLKPNDTTVSGGNVFGEMNGNGKGDYLDRFPEFPLGGMDGVRTYIEYNTKYPPEAQKQKIKGTVIVSFDVNFNGEIVNIKIEQSDNTIFNDEAYNVVKNMPRWKPGLRHGKPVIVKFLIPISFYP